MAVKRLAKPKARRNITEKTPSKSRALKPCASLNRFGITRARAKMTTACIIPLTALDSTRDRNIEVLGIGAARSALSMLKRLSKTMDIPLKAALNNNIRHSIPPRQVSDVVRCACEGLGENGLPDGVQAKPLGKRYVRGTRLVGLNAFPNRASQTSG